MEYLAGLAGQLLGALVTPINCVGNLGHDVLVASGTFVQCVGSNLLGAANTVVTASADTVSNVAGAVSNIGG